MQFSLYTNRIQVDIQTIEENVFQFPNLEEYLKNLMQIIFFKIITNLKKKLLRIFFKKLQFCH